MGIFIFSAILIIGGLIFASQSHSLLQGIYQAERSFGGLGGLVMVVTDVLGATDNYETKFRLEVIRAASAGVAIVGVLVGLYGVSRAIRPINSSESPAKEPPVRPIPRLNASLSHPPRLPANYPQDGVQESGGGPHTWRIKLAEDDLIHTVTFINRGRHNVVRLNDTILGEYLIQGMKGAIRRFTFTIGQERYPAQLVTEIGRDWGGIGNGNYTRLYVGDQLIPPRRYGRAVEDVRPIGPDRLSEGPSTPQAVPEYGQLELPRDIGVRQWGIRRKEQHSWQMNLLDGTSHSVTVVQLGTHNLVRLDGAILDEYSIGEHFLTGFSGFFPGSRRVFDFTIAGERAQLETQAVWFGYSTRLYVDDQLIP